jgi:hypothetical protein
MEEAAPLPSVQRSVLRISFRDEKYRPIIVWLPFAVFFFAASVFRGFDPLNLSFNLADSVATLKL